jgi:arsenate reductase-like glutaredoxin family protein
LEVQVFGTRKSADTTKPLRYFAERRVKVHFVDLAERAASPGELKRFIQKFGVESLLDRDGSRFAELGLKAARLSEESWIARLTDEPGLLRVPLVRFQQKLTVGPAESDWKSWIQAAS